MAERYDRSFCQWSLELILGSCGSDPIAVGYKRISAPIKVIDLAHSGNHWSQQIPQPIFPKSVLKTLKPVFPGVK